MYETIPIITQFSHWLYHGPCRGSQAPHVGASKTWTYIYHYVEILPTDIEGDILPDADGWPVEYTLNGDTVIDGRQYMKMYRFDIATYKTEYYAAYREDEEGRVYVTDDRGRRDFKLIDFTNPLPVLDNDYPMPYNDPGSAFTETIKANGNLFTRYRYTNSNAVQLFDTRLISHRSADVRHTENRSAVRREQHLHFGQRSHT